MVRNILLGVKKFTSKDGQRYEIMTLASDPTDDEYLNGSFGKLTEEIFVPAPMHNRLNMDDLGKEIALDYEVTRGRAKLIGFQVVRTDENLTKKPEK